MELTPRNKERWERLVGWFIPPRDGVALTTLQTILYAALSLAGFSAIFSPPRTIVAAMGTDLTVIWAVALAAGGALAALSFPRGLWWMERIGLAPMLGGAVLYLAVVITEHFSASAGSRLTQAFFITAVVITLLIRIVRVWNLWRDPRKMPTGPIEPAHD